MNVEAQLEGYAYGKLSELVESLFCDIRPARQALLEHYHLLFIIAPTDFKAEGLQMEWASIQRALKGKMRNYGSERIPVERLTLRNATLERVLRSMWRIYSELHQEEE